MKLALPSRLKFNSLQAYAAVSTTSLAFFCAAGLGDSTPAYAQINPGYLISGTTITGNAPSDASYGLLFTVGKPGYSVNALGFRKPDSWPSGKDYTVTLYSYINKGFSAGDYTIKAQRVFKQSETASYQLIDGYYYQPTDSLIPLDVTTFSGTPPASENGYELSTTGDFTTSGIPYVGNGIYNFSSPLAIDFSAGILVPGAGYGYVGDTGFPIPLTPASATGGLTAGYWNANLSVSVPGPLPIVGAAAAYGWTRRLRRRVRKLG